MHILLVEPDILQARAIRHVFECAGHSVAHAVSAQGAVAQADQRVPDIVILELELPRHNGVEFLYEFRSYPEWLSIPIVLHTAVSPQSLEHAATLERELGVIRVLHKPTTDLSRLATVVQSFAPGGDA